MSTPPTTQATSGAGFMRVLLATALVGIAGYVITWVVPRTIGVGPYAVFAIFWSFTFLLAAGLSGIQQEITRATRPLSKLAKQRPGRARNFAFLLSASAFALVVASAPFWVDRLFPAEGWALVWPLAVSAGAYVLLATLAGTLYGTSAWKPLFWVIFSEGFLRLVFIGVVLRLTSSPVALAWAIAAPFPLTVAAVWLGVRRKLAGTTGLDVELRQLSWNVVRTIVAATSMGVLVSGFPLLLGLTSPDTPELELGLLVLVATLVRAPLIVVGMALQSYLVVLFRESRDQFWPLLLKLELIVLALGAALSVLGWFLGPAVFEFLFPGEPVPSASLIAALVGSSALVGALCITAPAVLSQARHSAFSAGWVAAAVATFLCLLLPLPFETRAVVSLIVGPSAGLVVHVGALAVLRSRGIRVAPIDRAAEGS